MKKHIRFKVNLQLVGIFLSLLLLVIGIREYRKNQAQDRFPDLPQLHVNGELRVITLYGPSSYFIYRDKEMGYEYEICSLLANDLGLHVKMIVAPNRLAMYQMLKNGIGDVIAYNMPVKQENKTDFDYCGRVFLSKQVIVQRRNSENPIIQRVTDLNGKTIVVHENSAYLDRLQNLNEEIGGEIDIETIPEDSLSEEELIAMVAKGNIDYTVSDNNIAAYNTTFYPNIHSGLNISFPQRSSWAVRKSSVKLAQAIDLWFKENIETKRYREIRHKYFEEEKRNYSQKRFNQLPIKKGQISIYDELFKYHAEKIGWDWRLLASIAYQESEFQHRATNWTGATGLMQIMPKTGKAMGVSKDSLFVPYYSILAASRLLKHYERKLKDIKNPEEKLKITLAAYNCGIGHIFDARELTRKYGGNPSHWEGQVEKYVLLKSRSEYYEDPVCKQGYLRGGETVAFVAEVWERYQFYQKTVKKNVSNHQSK